MTKSKTTRPPVNSLKIYRALVESGKSLAEVEQDYIFAALDHFKGNRTHTAKFLKISLRCIRYKVNEIISHEHDV